MVANKEVFTHEITKNIFAINNLVSQEDIELFIKFIDEYQDIAFLGQEGRRRSIPLGVVPFSSSVWNIENVRKIKLRNFPIEVQKAFKIVVEKIIFMIRDLYKDQDDMHCSNAIFAKQLPGGQVPIHKDTAPGFDEHLLYSAVLYLNTIQDGDISFPALGVSHRPTAGDLLLYRSDHENSEHEVVSISEVRYSIPIFISKDKNCYIE